GGLASFRPSSGDRGEDRLPGAVDHRRDIGRPRVGRGGSTEHPHQVEGGGTQGRRFLKTRLDQSAQLERELVEPTVSAPGRPTEDGGPGVDVDGGSGTALRGGESGVGGLVVHLRHGPFETGVGEGRTVFGEQDRVRGQDRKSTRLNSSHVSISYAVFCLKKKNNRDIRAR